MLFHQPSNSQGNYSYNAHVYDAVDFDAHFHRNLELIYVFSGAIHCTAGDKTARLTAGDFAMVLSNEIHSLKTDGDSRCWIGVFSGDFVRAFEMKTKGMVGDAITFRCHESVVQYLKSNLLHEEVVPVLSLKSCLYAACDAYCNAVKLLPYSGKSGILMRAILDYIEKNYQQKLSLSQMAEALGYNYHYLSKCFHKIFDMSFSDYLNSYRLDVALGLLVESDSDITEIALESGFQSIRNFNAVFKQHTGITPAQYRKMSRS